VGSVAFNSDGSLLATGSDDGTVRLIRTADGGEAARVEHDGTVRSVAFSPDGSLLATGSHDGTARLWLAPERLMAKLCQERAGRNLSADVAAAAAELWLNLGDAA
jgi:WD40 repeat protein